jgi:pimeloyl-ACP methyl ester carboxylesterase
MSEPYVATSRIVDLDGPTHYLDFGGPAGAPLIVAIHGLGGAAWNWLAVAPLLTTRCRMIAIDLAGHGESPRVARSTTVRANRQLLDRFLREVVAEPAVLMGNSMGGLITMLQTAASPDLVEGAVLVNPAMPGPILRTVDRRMVLDLAIMAMPRLGEAAMGRRRRRVTVPQQVRESLQMCTVDLDRVPVEVIDAGITSIESRKPGDFSATDVTMAGRSLIAMLSRPQSLRQRIKDIKVPVLLLHGEKDRLVSVKLARQAAKSFPEWRYDEAADIGHVPMLEAPGWTAEKVLAWLAKDAQLLS